MTPPILGLTEKDFDAYLPERATSNAYSRPRLEFKQRALAWVRTVISRLQDLGIPVDVHASDEHPSVWNSHRVDCQWVFLWRDAATRADLDLLLDQKRGIAQALQDPSPFFRHAFLALRVDHEKVEVCAQVHPDAWVDFETLQARLADDARSASLIDAIHELPEQFSAGPWAGADTPCIAVSRTALVSWLERCSSERRPLWIGWSVPRQVAVEHSELLDEQLADAILALAPVYRHIAWAPSDDPAGIQERLNGVRQDLLRAAAERAAQLGREKAEADRQRSEVTEKARERTRERVESRQRPNLGNLFKQDSPAGAPKPAAAAQPRAPLPPPPASAKPKAPSAPRKPEPEPEPKQARRPPAEPVERPDEPVEKGSKVKILSGPFSGKLGVVSELDTRGGARILLGLLSARVALDELTVVSDAAARPPMMSSHRKPMPPARPAKEPRDK